MILIHAMNTLPRLVETALAQRLRVMPAVVVTGARQTGKSTLVEERVTGARRYAPLDDLDVLDAARRDPETLVGGPSPVTLDEVQREPALLASVKRANVSRTRSSGPRGNQRASRFPPPDASGLLASRAVDQPDGTRTRCRARAADGASLAQPARDVLSSRHASGL